jgi:hypothetical protein
MNSTADLSSVLEYELHGGPVYVAAAHTVVDGIKDHKLVLVPRNQSDRLCLQTTKLGHLV